VSATDAHLDLHFRLTHHDLLADLIDAVGSMKDAGGIAGLDARKVRGKYRVRQRQLGVDPMHGNDMLFM
jgi:hypothetical protein